MHNLGMIEGVHTTRFPDGPCIRRWSSTEWPEVRFYLADLSALPSTASQACLDDAERARATRFRYPVHARRHLVSHVALRQVLSAETGLPAASLVWQHGPDGKPGLALPSPLHFNMAHSEDLALIAVSPTRPLGVDLECPGRPLDDDQVARHILADHEWALWQALPPNDRPRAFLQAWTRKEACLKALGVGLAMAPSTVTAGLGPQACTLTLTHGAQTMALTVQNIALPAEAWSDGDTFAPPIAALAVVG